MSDLSLLRAVLWQRDDAAGAEYGALWRDGSGWQLRGTIVSAVEATPLYVRYGILVDKSWHTGAVHIAVRAGAPERALHLAVRDRKWTANGRPAGELDGCTDIDLNISPSTPAIPIRRLRLAVGQTATVMTASVSFPALAYRPRQYRYSRVAEDRYVLSDSELSAELIVDDQGLVVNYRPGWTRAAVKSVSRPS